MNNSQPMRAPMSEDLNNSSETPSPGKAWRGLLGTTGEPAPPYPGPGRCWGRWGALRYVDRPGKGNRRRSTGLINAPQPLRRLMCGQQETNECNLFRLS